jgi:hypothetical protein
LKKEINDSVSICLLIWLLGFLIVFAGAALQMFYRLLLFGSIIYYSGYVVAFVGLGLLVLVFVKN